MDVTAGGRREPAGGLLENKVFNKRAAPAPFTAQGRTEGTDRRAAGDDAVTAMERGAGGKGEGGGGGLPPSGTPSATGLHPVFQVHTTKGEARGARRVRWEAAQDPAR